jgi:hypothetical protein
MGGTTEFTIGSTDYILEEGSILSIINPEETDLLIRDATDTAKKHTLFRLERTGTHELEAVFEKNYPIGAIIEEDMPEPLQELGLKRIKITE